MNYDQRYTRGGGGGGVSRGNIAQQAKRDKNRDLECWESLEGRVP